MRAARQAPLRGAVDQQELSAPDLIHQFCSRCERTDWLTAN
jgi:hypothetical protein